MTAISCGARSGLLIALALACAGPGLSIPAHAQTAPGAATPPDKPATVLPPLPPAVIDNGLTVAGEDIAARKVESRMTVAVRIEGHGPYRFVVDSGADTSVLGTDIARSLRLPAVEPMIAASLLVLGLLVATRTHAPAALAAALVGLFAMFHGVAHGSELVGDASIWPTLAGMLLCTAALHVTGLGLGLALRSRSPWWPRLAGGAGTTLGGALLLQLT